MKTKDKILLTSLKLLNEQGVKSVTIRHIAKEMGISHGNLGYHYPNLDTIIQDLYFQLVSLMNAEIEKLQGDPVSLQLMYKTNKIIFETIYKFRFMFLDFVEICRSNPTIMDYHRQLMSNRKMQLLFITTNLQEQGIIRTDFSTEQFESFIMTLFITTEFWLSSSMILYQGEEEDKVTYYLKFFCSQLIPYLTVEGRKQFDIIMKANQ